MRVFLNDSPVKLLESKYNINQTYTAQWTIID